MGSSYLRKSPQTLSPKLLVCGPLVGFVGLEGIQQATVPILRTPRPGDASASAFSGEVQRAGIQTNPSYLVAAGILGSLLIGVAKLGLLLFMSWQVVSFIVAGFRIPGCAGSLGSSKRYNTQLSKVIEIISSWTRDLRALQYAAWLTLCACAIMRWHLRSHIWN